MNHRQEFEFVCPIKDPEALPIFVWDFFLAVAGCTFCSFYKLWSHLILSCKSKWSYWVVNWASSCRTITPTLSLIAPVRQSKDCYGRRRMLHFYGKALLTFNAIMSCIYKTPVNAFVVLDHHHHHLFLSSSTEDKVPGAVEPEEEAGHPLAVWLISVWFGVFLVQIHQS